ncbi:unnamed protein product [Boreogadus saida]
MTMRGNSVNEDVVQWSPVEPPATRPIERTREGTRVDGGHSGDQHLHSDAAIHILCMLALKRPCPVRHLLSRTQDFRLSLDCHRCLGSLSAAAAKPFRSAAHADLSVLMIERIRLPQEDVDADPRSVLWLVPPTAGTL